jgi:mycofactocin system creatininase family protein
VGDTGSVTSDPASPNLGERTTTDLDVAIESYVLAVPLGSTEQHGPHLPLATDTVIAAALAERLAARRPDVLAAPALPYGSSGEHAAFPGTLSIGQQALEAVVVELVRSADRFAATVLVCGHAGNAEPVARAVRTLRAEGRPVGAWFPVVPGGDAHAGRTETALVLALRPELVRVDLARPGLTTPLPEVLDALKASGVAAVSPSGVLGDPTGAEASEGTDLVERFLTELDALVEGLLPH